MWVQKTLSKEHFYISADRWHSESAEEIIFIPSRPPLFLSGDRMAVVLQMVCAAV